MRGVSGWAAAVRGSKVTWRTVLLWWKDGGVNDILTNECLMTGRCYAGSWFELDEALLSEFGRAVYYETVYFADKESR